MTISFVTIAVHPGGVFDGKVGGVAVQKACDLAI